MMKKHRKDKRGMSEKENIVPNEELEKEAADSTEVTEPIEAKIKQCNSEVDENDVKISQLEKELSETKDKYLRTVAEYDNYRKRTTKEKIEAYGDATAKAITEILSVIDNFERALQTETTDETFKNGIQMIFNQYNDILKKLGVEEVEALNKPFDPSMHNAINQVEDENFEENTVCQVFQKGYKINDKVIRYAMVTVANP